MLEGMDFVFSQNSDIDFGYQFGDPTVSVKIVRLGCKISEEGCSRNLEGMEYVFFIKNQILFVIMKWVYVLESAE